MPIRGENIGTAYVRILADGRDLDDSLREMFDDTEGTLDGAGRRGSAAYREGFTEELQKAPSRNEFNDAIRKALIGGDALTSSFFADKDWQQFRAALGKEFGDAGRLAGDRMEQSLLRTGLDGLAPMLDDLQRIVVDSQAELFRKQEQIDREHAKALAENERRDLATFLAISRDHDEQWEREHQQHLDRIKEAEAEAHKDRLDADRDFERRVSDLLEARMAQERLGAEMHADWVKEGIDLDRELSQAHADANRRAAELSDTYALLNRETTQLVAGDLRNAQSKRTLLGYIRELRTGMADLNIKNDVWDESLRDTERTLILLNPRINSLNKGLTRTADLVGIAFGRGSRNNFLNFMGSFARNMALAPRLFTGIADSLLRFRGEAGLAFRDVRNQGGSTFRALAAGAGTLLSRLGTLPFAIAGGVAGAFGFAGPMLSILSQLTGVVVALAGSISMGLVGAVGALAGTITPAVVGVGTLALAFYDLEKAEQKALKADVSPIVRSFGRLADVARGDIFDDLGEQSTRFAAIIDSTQGIVAGVGDEIRQIGNRWLDMMEGPGFTRFVDSMEKFLPDAVGRLGDIFGQTFGGIGGLLRGLIPITRDFLAWLDDVTAGFSEWANSVRGQNEIKEFMEDAADSARELGDFIGAVSDLFWTLVDTGNEAGDSLFGSMTDALQRWNETLRADNGAVLRQWFEDAVDFGEAVGGAISSIGRLFSTLDTEASRMIATQLFEGLAAALQLLSDLLGPVARLLDGANSATDGLVVSLGALILVGPKLLGMLTATTAGITGFTGGLRNAETRMSTFRAGLRNVAGVGGLGLMAAGATQADNAMGVLLQTLGGAATGFALGGPIGALIGGGLGGLLGIVTASKRAGEASENLVGNFEGLAGTLDAVTGAATEATRALVYNQLAEVGALGALEAQGVSRRTAIDAMLGQKNALEQVTAALDREDAAVADSEAALQRLIDKRAELAKVASPDAQNFDPGAQDRIDAIDEEIEALEESIQTRKDRNATVRNGIGLAQEEGRAVREQSQAVREYSKNMKAIPRSIETKIKESGIVPTTKGIVNLAEKYDLVDKRQVRTLISESGADTTVKKVLNIIEKNKTLDEQKPTPKIDADTRSFDGKMRGAEGALRGLVLGRYVPRVDVDTSGALRGVQSVESWLNSIQDEIVYVNVARRSGGVQEFTAAGGIFVGSQQRTIGEAGTEAVVPLNRDLSLVDPAVRWLSAIAQGIMPAGGPGVDVGGITIITPTEDPHAVAKETINAIMGATLN